jgi:hypothetical protein
MTDRLSTADLAGGTAATTRQTDPAVTERHDGDFDANRDRDFRADNDFRTDTAERTGATTRDPSMSTTPRRTSGFANPAATDGSATNMDNAEPMFPAGEVDVFRARWSEVQTGFVDEPRSAVEQADSLVAEMMKRLAQVFADERGKLEEQWSRGDDISTEDLRQALRRYRSFMDRLLSI